MDVIDVEMEGAITASSSSSSSSQKWSEADADSIITAPTRIQALNKAHDDKNKKQKDEKKEEKEEEKPLIRTKAESAALQKKVQANLKLFAH